MLLKKTHKNQNKPNILTHKKLHKMKNPPKSLTKQKTHKTPKNKNPRRPTPKPRKKEVLILCQTLERNYLGHVF